jgi:hypothetical protein
VLSGSLSQDILDGISRDLMSWLNFPPDFITDSCQRTYGSFSRIRSDSRLNRMDSEVDFVSRKRPNLFEFLSESEHPPPSAAPWSNEGRCVITTWEWATIP